MPSQLLTVRTCIVSTTGACLTEVFPPVKAFSKSRCGLLLRCVQYRTLPTAPLIAPYHGVHVQHVE